MYRNEDKEAVADKWQGWADLFQFGSLGGLTVMIAILGVLPKETAQVAVWPMAGFLLATTFIGFMLGRKALKHRMIYLDAEHSRVLGIFDRAIAYAKKHRL